MIYLLILTIPITANLNLPAGEVLETAREVLAGWGVPVCEASNNGLTTKAIEMDIKTMNNYIREDQPDDNPGWTGGRFSLVIRVGKVSKQKTELKVEASLERYGTPSAMLLIPPIWTPVPSNGNLENEVINEIERRLTPREEK